MALEKLISIQTCAIPGYGPCIVSILSNLCLRGGQFVSIVKIPWNPGL